MPRSSRWRVRATASARRRRRRSDGQRAGAAMAHANAEAAQPLPVVHPAALERAPDAPRWLVDGLWSAEGVGVIGGAPKCCKTWLSLELALGVAAGCDVLGRFPVESAGSVLVYGAEDRAEQLRERMEAICTARSLVLDELPVGLIAVPSLRLDDERDLSRLRATIAQHQPRLLILDPLVRLHRCDENSAGEMSVLLANLRALQREHGVALVIVHHLSKAPFARPGQALRGSGDLHAWGDSNLYLRHRSGELLLYVEHRAAPSPEPFAIELVTEPAPHLEVAERDGAPAPRAARSQNASSLRSTAPAR
ncbi:MAG TPA: AAA family ATPase [Polyangiaceae bacterium]|nr:AAA family ATPase [Polyangiaceae bacterium]